MDIYKGKVAELLEARNAYSKLNKNEQRNFLS
jgi:hypothetical protein